MKMEERMHSLEDALAIIQGSGSCKPYPLPNGEWSSREMYQTPEVDQDPIMDNEFHKYGLADALDSLCLSGESSPSDPPFGPSGSSEVRN